MLKAAYYTAGAAWAALQSARPTGRSIYNAEWDICIILDAARADMTAELAPSAWPASAAWSRGSITTEWLASTFTPAYAAEIAGTTLVTANPHSQTVFGERSWLTDGDVAPVPYPDVPAVDRDAFGAVYELWRTHATDHHAVPAQTMRDATAAAYDRHGPSVVAHWLQPHEPFIAPDAPTVGGTATGTKLWEQCRRGDVDRGAVVEAYRANLRHALEHVERLSRAVDARILVTADHGNAFGEWGVWGHPFGWPHPSVRRVPWLFVDATADAPVDPGGILNGSPSTADRDAQLRALGYR